MKNRLTILILLVTILIGCARTNPVDIFEKNDIVKIELVNWDEKHIINDKDNISKIYDFFHDVTFYKEEKTNKTGVLHELTIFHDNGAVENISFSGGQICVTSLSQTDTYNCSATEKEKLIKELWNIYNNSYSNSHSGA